MFYIIPQIIKGLSFSHFVCLFKFQDNTGWREAPQLFTSYNTVNKVKLHQSVLSMYHNLT
jgi:hypothetical protein